MSLIRSGPTTGKLQIPITTFGELIVGRNADSDKKTDNEVEEVEIFEYRLVRQQLSSLRTLCPYENRILDLAYPAIAGSEVITCDNSQYSPRHPHDKDRAGLVYSVPFYAPNGRLKGEISGVFLTQRLQELLPLGNFALHSQTYDYIAGSLRDGPARAARAEVAADRPDPHLLYSEVIALKLRHTGAVWTLWAGQSDADYWARADVIAAHRAANIGYVSCVMVAFGLCVFVRGTRQRRQLVEQQNCELELKVRQRTAALEQSSREAEAATRAKSAFLANMSHEIRTPMNDVLNMTELLRGTPLSEQQRRFTDLLYRSGEALLQIINSILDFSKIESGKFELESVAFDLPELFHEVADLFSAASQKSGVELVCVIGDEVPRDTFLGDATRWR